MFCHASAIHPTAEAGQARYGLSGAIPVSKEPYRMKHHLHGKEAGEIAKTSRVKKLLLTHLPEKEVDLLLSEAKEIHEDTEVSEILKSYQI